MKAIGINLIRTSQSWPLMMADHRLKYHDGKIVK